MSASSSDCRFDQPVVDTRREHGSGAHDSGLLEMVVSVVNSFVGLSARQMPDMLCVRMPDQHSVASCTEQTNQRTRVNGDLKKCGL